jgi:calcineurin-like phosphoesterase family protein
MIINKSVSDFFITSDTWFGREQILNIGNRYKFSSLSKMNDTLIKNWNKKVSNSDIVIHLGNFAWDPKTADEVLKKLNGNIIFIEGNEDDALLEVCDSFSNVTLLKDQIIELPDFDSVLCHYPLDDWNGKSTGTLHFHGHTIFSHKTDLSLMNRINVCTDFWNYSPITYSTIKEFINEKK